MRASHYKIGPSGNDTTLNAKPLLMAVRVLTQCSDGIVAGDARLRTRDYVSIPLRPSSLNEFCRARDADFLELCEYRSKRCCGGRIARWIVLLQKFYKGVNIFKRLISPLAEMLRVV